ELGMGHADDRLAREVLRILDDVLDRVDRGDRGLAVGKRLQHLFRRALPDPTLDDLVQLVDVLDPAHVVGEPRLLDQIRAPDDPPVSAAIPAPSASGGKAGGVSGQPLMWAKPEIDSASVPNPGRWL